MSPDLARRVGRTRRYDGSDPLTDEKRWAEPNSSSPFWSNLDLFRYRDRVVDLNAQVPDGALDFGVPHATALPPVVIAVIAILLAGGRTYN